MEFTTEMLAKQRELQVRRDLAHAIPNLPYRHPVRRRTARSLRRIANAIDAY